jgi:hypothetical protein
MRSAGGVQVMRIVKIKSLTCVLHNHEAISQSLAGRAAMLALWPFSLREIRRYESTRDPFDLIRRGFFQRLHEESLEPRRFSTPISRPTSSGMCAR